MKKILLLVLGLLIFIACESSTSDPIKSGKVRVTVTDAPYPIEFIAKAEVVVKKVEIKMVGESDTTAFVTLSEEEKTFDLVQLRNGLTEFFGEAEVEPGVYSELRLITGDAYVMLTDSTVFDLKIPSGGSSGIKIKIKPDLIVSENGISEILLDFDLSKSFVIKGNANNVKEPKDIKGFNFKPVVRAINQDLSSRIEGTVNDDSSRVVEDATVWISNQDSILTTTFTETNGKYALLGIPAGTYNLFATKEGYDTVKVENLILGEAEKKIQNFVLTKR